eukprot:TRINITY_DN18065_c0_g1_i1.p1 TRINITY_DN18065_c0_g1~~TRINITY_DN18065_c0_g1_i1.p1  ORF type:complete len:232 (-),score=15.73 TRINITY_DN18065_c0_g1_i1:24-638(-)
MGEAISSIKEAINEKPKPKVVITGLDAGGKTNILRKVATTEFVTHTPALGLYVNTVESKYFDFVCFSLGGSLKLHFLWRHYYKEVQGFVFVIDSTDRERIDQAMEELTRALNEKELQGVQVLIFANKLDLACAMNLEEIKQKLPIELLAKRQWYFQGCSAVRNEGINEGFTWLINSINSEDQEEFLRFIVELFKRCIERMAIPL